jgi:hypothetical protein
MQNFDQVQRAYDELVKSGDIYYVGASAPQDIIENQKAYLTRRAAYYLNLINPDFGLLSKTTGNNVMGLSTDIVVKHNGNYYDIATDAAIGNDSRLVQPVNSSVVSDPLLASRWVQPTKELAGLTSPIPVPTPIPVPIPPVIPPITPSNDYKEIINKLDALNNNQVEAFNTITELLKLIVNKPITVTFPDYKSSGWLTITLSPVKK